MRFSLLRECAARRGICLSSGTMFLGVIGMAREDKWNRLIRVLRGVVLASAITLVGMAGLSALVIYAGLEDGALTILNQALKLASILLGTLFAVGVGGEKGLATGAVVGILYILVGYGFYCLIDGSEASASAMAVEECAGALAGGLFGMLIANLRPMRRRA